MYRRRRLTSSGRSRPRAARHRWEPPRTAIVLGVMLACGGLLLPGLISATSNPSSRVHAPVGLIAKAMASTIGETKTTAKTPAAPVGPNETSWPTFLGGVDRASANLAESVISPQSALNLTTRWGLAVGGGSTSSMAFDGGQLYFGTVSGNEYDVNASTGQVVWNVSLGNYSHCYGIYSSPAVSGGTVYTGGPDNYWYALNASTGATEWKVLVDPASLNSFDWASSLVFDGFLYIGVASCMDNPLIPGKLLQVDLTGNHTIVHEFDTQSGGSVGDSVWASPAGDSLENLVWVATGNGNDNYSDALIALNASTLQLVGYWHIPSNTLGDSDFGSTPILVRDSTGRPLVVDTNKNGLAYALDRRNVSANGSWNPVWSLNTHGYYADAAFDGHTLYLVGGAIAGHGDSLYAVNPLDGSITWQADSGFTSPWVGGPAYANGIVVDSQADWVQVRNASTGALVRTLTIGTCCGGSGPGAPIVVDGQIFASSGTTVADFGIPFRASMLLQSTTTEAGLPVAALAACTGGAPPYHATWSVGSTRQATGLSASLSFDFAGNFSVVVTITDAFGSVVSQTWTVRVWSPLVANITSVSFFGELPSWTGIFLSQVSGGAPGMYSYIWGLSPGFANQTTPWALYTVNSAGTYTLTLAVTDSLGFVSRSSHLVQVEPTINVAASASVTSGELPLTTAFTATVQGGLEPIEVSWVFGDGSTSVTGVDVRHSFGLPGDYEVTASASDALGQTQSARVWVLVLPPLFAAISLNTTLGGCLTYPAQLPFAATAYGGEPPYSFQWTMDTQLPQTGNYSEWLTATSPGVHRVGLLVRDAWGYISQRTENLSTPLACQPVQSQPPPSGGQDTGGLTVWLEVLWVDALAAVGAAVALMGLRRAPRQPPLNPFGEPLTPQPPQGGNR